MINVFVFGTLKQGFPNFYLNQGKKLEDHFITQTTYLFYLVGERHTPCIFEKQGEGSGIQGEVYQVTDKQLKVLDQLERVDEPDGYFREKITVINTKTHETIEAYIYLKTEEQIDPTEIKIGPIDCYLEEHATLYKYRPQ